LFSVSMIWLGIEVIIWKTALWGHRALLDGFTEHNMTASSTSNAKIWVEVIFKPTFGNESWHEARNDKVRTVVNSASLTKILLSRVESSHNVSAFKRS